MGDTFLYLIEPASDLASYNDTVKTLLYFLMLTFLLFNSVLQLNYSLVQTQWP